ncbi:MAG TPA: hypothetical protein VK645_06445 [Chitinophagaceae bacterium]|nr:hypothetical protein [Chitinophagaceae bacterium]
MKQKIIYAVIVVVSMHLPASSKECAKIFLRTMPEKTRKVVEKPAVAAEEISHLPVSVFSKLVFKL